MKKLILVILVFMLYNCQVEVKQNPSTAGVYPTYIVADDVPRGYNGESKISVTVYEWEGVEYRIFTNDTYDGKSIFVVNHTKEKLEIQLMRAQLMNMKH